MNPPSDPSTDADVPKLFVPLNDRSEAVKLGLLFGAIYFIQGISEPTDGLIAQPVRSLLKSWGYSTTQVRCSPRFSPFPGGSSRSTDSFPISCPGTIPPPELPDPHHGGHGDQLGYMSLHLSLRLRSDG